MLHEARVRSGWEARARPVERYRHDPLDRDIAERLRASPPPLVDHLCRVAEARGAATLATTEALGTRLAAYDRGEVRMFSRWTAGFGQPLDWHLEPCRGTRWPAEVHWSRIPLGNPARGDVKRTWELGRQAVAFDWARHAALAGVELPRRQFHDTLESFERANRFRAGVHWASGQEVAIRLLAWWFAFGSLGGAAAFEPETVERFVRLSRYHARHLDEQIGFARHAVRNNHLIGEALGLVLAGLVMVEDPAAGHWRVCGLRLLAEDALRQFIADGGYVQASHNYHRLALHYLVWWALLADLHGLPRPKAMEEVLRRSRDQLLGLQNPADGRLPNWGANDGALLNPLTECGFADFRPVVRTVSAVLGDPSPYPPGPWDEEAHWLVARPYPERRAERLDPPDEFPVSGLYVTSGGGGARAILRAGATAARFGQADQNHLDVWWNGVNVVLDPGSFGYNDRLEFHDAFMGTSSHSTVGVEGLDQMDRVRRFTWLDPPGVTVERLERRADGTLRSVAATHDGYARPGAPGILHRRMVEWRDPTTLIVRDELTRAPSAAGERTRVRLHWLLADRVTAEAFVAEAWVRLQLGPDAGALEIQVLAEDVREERRSMARAVDGAPRGWHAPHYGELEPAVSLAVEGVIGETGRFVTEFRGPAAR